MARAGLPQIEVFNPFPGLRPFGPEEAHLFFGREEHIDELLEKLRRHRFVSLIGSSGSGKSSLVLAGLFPALNGGAAGAEWRIACMRPGNDPIRNLARALRDPAVLAGSGETDRTDPNEAELECDITEATLKRSHLGLIRAVEEIRLRPGESLLLLVDQFEELFRYDRMAAGVAGDLTKAFVQLILEAARQPGLPIHILITMRSELLGQCVRFPGLPEAINAGQYLIPRLNRRQRESVIVGPARVGGAEISAPLLQRLLNDVGDNPDQLPILQHALMRTFDLWRKRERPDEPIGLADYEAAGTMARALSQHAEEIFAELTADQRRTTETLFRSLTGKSAEGYEIRRPASLGEIAGIAGATVEEVLDVVERFRAPGRTFLVLPSGVPVSAGTMVDISHESLMRIWDRLRAWTRDEAEAAEFYRRLALAVRLHAAGEAGLWRDPELELGLRWRERQKPNAAWARRYGFALEPALELLERSREARDQEREEKEAARRHELEQAQALAEAEQLRAEAERRTAERLRRTVLAVSVALLVAVVSTIWAVAQDQKAQKLSRASAEQEVLALAASADHLVDAGNRFSALLEALQAGERLRRLTARVGPEPELRQSVEDTLIHALFGLVETNRWYAHAAWPTTLAFNHDGSELISAGWEQIIRRWKVDGTALPSLVGHAAPVFALAASPVDAGLVSGDGAGALRFWRPDGRSVEVPRAHDGKAVRSLHYSPDGSLVASGGDDGRIRLWHPDGTPADTGPPPLKCKIQSVRFHPREPLLASGCDDGMVDLWRRGPDGAWSLWIEIHAHAGPVTALSFDASGERFASAGADGWTRLWSLQGSPLATYESNGPVYAVTFGPGDRSVVSGGADHAIRIWSDDGQKTVLTEHPQPVTGLALSPDGRTLASTSRDMTVRLWQLDNPYATTLTGHRGTVWEVDINASGSLIASGGDDGSVKLWSTGGRLLASFDAFHSLARTVRFSPDGHILAAASHDGNVRFWEVGDGGNAREIARFLADPAGVNEISFSPDGRTVVTAGLGGLLCFWRVAPGEGHPIGQMRPGGQIWGARFGPAGELLWMGSDPDVRLRLAGRSEALHLRGHAGGVVRGDFSPQSHRIATAEVRGTAILWRSDDGFMIRRLSGSHQANSVEFSPDGEQLAVAGLDGVVRLWRADDGKLRRSLLGHSSSVTFAAFDPGGRFLVTSSADETIRIWRHLDLGFAELMAAGERWVRDYRHLPAEVRE